MAWYFSHSQLQPWNTIKKRLFNRLNLTDEGFAFNFGEDEELKDSVMHKSSKRIEFLELLMLLFDFVES